MKVGELIQGQFAITDSGMGILCLSDLSFVPYDQENANVVPLANGIGGFPKKQRCRVVAAQEAWSATEEWF